MVTAVLPIIPIKRASPLGVPLLPAWWACLVSGYYFGTQMGSVSKRLLFGTKEVSYTTSALEHSVRLFLFFIISSRCLFHTSYSLEHSFLDLLEHLAVNLLLLWASQQHGLSIKLMCDFVSIRQNEWEMLDVVALERRNEKGIPRTLKSFWNCYKRYDCFSSTAAVGPISFLVWFTAVGLCWLTCFLPPLHHKDSIVTSSFDRKHD